MLTDKQYYSSCYVAQSADVCCMHEAATTCGAQQAADQWISSITASAVLPSITTVQQV